ncbi:hypothetical protein WEH80_28200 [Actinomycetes bacterium KLBMP 9759]
MLTEHTQVGHRLDDRRAKIRAERVQPVEDRRGRHLRVDGEPVDAGGSLPRGRSLRERIEAAAGGARSDQRRREEGTPMHVHQT